MNSYTHWAYPEAHSDSRHERVSRSWRPFYVGKREAAERRFEKRCESRTTRRTTRRTLRTIRRND